MRELSKREMAACVHLSIISILALSWWLMTYMMGIPLQNNLQHHIEGISGMIAVLGTFFYITSLVFNGDSHD